MPIIVSRVASGMPADTCIPRLNEGDQVLYINGRDVTQHSHEQVCVIPRLELSSIIASSAPLAQQDNSLSVLPVGRVMIAQWESSLSVLSVARVMIAQQDSSLSVLPVARVMIAQQDSSLFVVPVARVMIAQWESSLSVLSMGPGS